MFNEKDALFIQDKRIIILGKLGYSSVAAESRAVYQTIQIYDLEERKFVQNLKDVFIVPSPHHEYQLFEKDKLMGLSENRSHFIIWSIETGQVSTCIAICTNRDISVKLELHHIYSTIATTGFLLKNMNCPVNRVAIAIYSVSIYV